MIEIVAGLALCLGVLILLGGVSAWAIVRMKRDRHRSGSSGALSGAMLEVQTLFEPSNRHVIRSSRAEEAEDRESDGVDADRNSGSRQRSDRDGR